MALPSFTVDAQTFEEFLELPMSSKMRQRVEIIVNRFNFSNGDYEDFIKYVDSEYQKCYKAQFGERPWSIDIFFVGRWIFEDDEKFRDLCLYLQDNGLMDEYF